MGIQECITITADDLRAAFVRGVRLDEIEAAARKRLKAPAQSQTGTDTLFLLRRVAPDMADMLENWPVSEIPRVKASGTLKKAVLLPFCPRMADAADFVRKHVKNSRPAVVAVDASPAEVGAALHYAFSLCSGLDLPARVSLVSDSRIMEEAVFQPGDFLPELAAYCFHNRIPVIPIGRRPRVVASEHQFTYLQLLQTAYDRFSENSGHGKTDRWLEKKAQELVQAVFAAGVDFVMEREDLISHSCYLASRLVDLSASAARGTILVLYSMKHALDLPGLVKTLQTTPAALSELYARSEPQPGGVYTMGPAEHQTVPVSSCAKRSCATKMAVAVDGLVQTRMHELVDSGEVDRLCADVAGRLRNHPGVERPPGVRGSLAAREIAQAYGLMGDGITRLAVAKACCIAFRHRTAVRQGEDVTRDDILKGIFSRVIYGMPLYPDGQEEKVPPRRPLTAEELSQALMGLSDAAFRTLSPEEALPLDDPAFAEEAMKHPLVQQALKDAMEQGLLQDVRQDYRDLLNEMEDRGQLELADSEHLTLTEEGKQTLQSRLEEMLARGEITPEEIAEQLKNSSALPVPQGMGGDTLSLSPQAETEFLAEMMDFQHEGRSASSSLEDLYVHYTINEQKGLKTSEDKADYEKLKVMIHQLEKKGLVDVQGEKKRFSLSAVSLERLLEGLVRRQESQMLERRAFRREHETDKTEIRRYRRGDTFRDLSVRHTLRRVVRKSKALGDIHYTDLRSFEKKPSNQLDIAVCVDISASMKESAKLRYAKMAVAELSRAAVGKQDRVGIVAFSNLGDVVVPLTDSITPLLNATMTLRAEQYTNIGNGLSCARKMLLSTKKGNPKYIILITDGEPNAALSDDEGMHHARVASFSRETNMETKKAMGTHHALMEAAKTSRKHIKISVVYISPQDCPDDASERTAREIARIGFGRFHKVQAIERLPLEALATVG